MRSVNFEILTVRSRLAFTAMALAAAASKRQSDSPRAPAASTSALFPYRRVEPLWWAVCSRARSNTRGCEDGAPTLLAERGWQESCLSSAVHRSLWVSVLQRRCARGTRGEVRAQRTRSYVATRVKDGTLYIATKSSAFKCGASMMKRTRSMRDAGRGKCYDARCVVRTVGNRYSGLRLLVQASQSEITKNKNGGVGLGRNDIGD